MKNDRFSLRADVFKALAHPTRLRVLDILLRDGERCVCKMSAELEVSQPTLSRHLSVLKDAGIVESEKDGLMVYYRIAAPGLREMIAGVDRILERDLHAQMTKLRI